MIAEPNRISIAVNKANFTHDLVKGSGKFNLSVLSEKAGGDCVTKKPVDTVL